MNSIVTDSDEPLPSLSDWHDYEPQLEFDDTELTHAPEQSELIQLFALFAIIYLNSLILYLFLF